MTMRLRAGVKDGHPTVTVVAGDQEWLGCGHSWCEGACGLPQLRAGENRVYGIMVAFGPVMRPPRVNFTGQSVQLPTDVGDWLKHRYWI